MRNLIKANLYYWARNFGVRLIFMVLLIGYSVIIIQNANENYGISSLSQLLDTSRLNGVYILEILLIFISNNIVLLSNNYIQNIVICCDKRWKVCFSMLIEDIIEISIVFLIIYIGVFLGGLFVTNIDYTPNVCIDFFRFVIIKWLSVIEMTLWVNATLFLTRRMLIALGGNVAMIIYFVFSGLMLTDAKDKYSMLMYYVPVQYLMNYDETMSINPFINLAVRTVFVICAFLISALAFGKKDLLRMERKEY